jgi:signal peptidase I
MSGTELGLVMVAAGLVAGAMLRRRLWVITVRGQSMTPTYRDGDRLLVWRPGRFRVRAGVVVVFAPPDAGPPLDVPWLVKRVVAVTGDQVPDDVRPVAGMARVPTGRLVVRGDGARSLDSRHFGLVDSGTVLGVVVRRLTVDAAARP